MSLFDLIWIAVIVLWILRSVSRASGRGAGSTGGTDVLPPDVEGEEASTAARANWRERLIEAAREWEAEQRRQAGEPVEVQTAETRPSPSARVGFPGATVPAPRQVEPPQEKVEVPSAYRRGERSGGVPPARRQRSSVLVRDVTPDRVEGGLAEATRPVPAAEATPSALRREEDVPEVAATPIESRRRRSPALPSALAVLERQPPLRRAILYREIFGPPKALSETGDVRES